METKTYRTLMNLVLILGAIAAFVIEPLLAVPVVIAGILLANAGDVEMAARGEGENKATRGRLKRRVAERKSELFTPDR